MSDAELFEQFRKNLSVSNRGDISTKYCNITTRLNADFWDLESDTRHSLQIGSYGRATAIDGVSDLDMVFELPPANLARYKSLQGNGPSAMLQEVKASLEKRYPKTDVSADGQIVGVNFTGYRVEVLPAFLDENGDYIHGDTNDGGSWKTTKPRPEIKAVNDLNQKTNGNLKDLCMMLRAWKNRAGVGVGGLLIDTLTYNFCSQHAGIEKLTYRDYPALMVSLFTHLGGLPDQDYWLAPGSNQRVRCKAKFQAKARKAAARCQEAVDATSENARSRIWKKVFGRQFPQPEAQRVEESAAIPITEAFIEDKFPVDIRYNLELDCEVIEKGNLVHMLRGLLSSKRRVPTERGLRFHVTACDVPGDYAILWKVRNRGAEAERRGMLRGEISFDEGSRREKRETANFTGDHYVEAYAVKNGVCVARCRIAVPI